MHRNCKIPEVAIRQLFQFIGTLYGIHAERIDHMCIDWQVAPQRIDPRLCVKQNRDIKRRIARTQSFAAAHIERRRGNRNRVTESGADPLFQQKIKLQEIDRFSQKIVETVFKEHFARCVCSVRSESNNRYSAIIRQRAQALRRFHTVHFRHHVIEHHQIVKILFCQFNRFSSARGQIDRHVIRLQQTGRDLEIDRTVVYNQHAYIFHPLRLPYDIRRGFILSRQGAYNPSVKQRQMDAIVAFERFNIFHRLKNLYEPDVRPSVHRAQSAYLGRRRHHVGIRLWIKAHGFHGGSAKRIIHAKARKVKFNRLLYASDFSTDQHVGMHALGHIGNGAIVQNLLQKRDCKHRAFSVFALNSDIAAHHARHLAPDCKAKPRADKRAVGFCIHLLVLRENLFKILRADSAAGILDRNNHPHHILARMFPSPIQTDITGLRKLLRIAQKIEQDLLDALVIPKQPDRRIGFDIDQQAYRLFGKAHADNMYNRFDQRRQHIFRLYQFELARFNF